MKRYSTAAGFGLAVLAVSALAGPAVAEEIPDPVGDFLDTYTGPLDPGLDVVAHQVTIVGDRVIFFGRMDGPIAPTQDFGGIYLFGVDRGLGTPRFLANEPIIGPNVVWDMVVRINPDGTGQVNKPITGVLTPLDRADISIEGNECTASVPLDLLLAEATRPPCQWTYNLWPRNGIVRGTNVHVSDLAPDHGNSPVQSMPEADCTTDLAALSPPNHEMLEVIVLVKTTDACADPADLDLRVIVTSDEPDNAQGNGDGNTTGDTNGEDGFTAPVDVTPFFAFNADTGCFEGSVFLRAERAGSGDGRTYTIAATVVNGDNNFATSSCTVVVPHDESE